LQGSQGVGKNTFVEAIGNLFGKHYIQLNSMSELTSKFNDHLKFAVLVLANESVWNGGKEALGVVKAMVTDKECTIEAKGKDRIKCINYRHLIISSNEDLPVHVDHDNRRFCAVRVSDKRINDFSYFISVKEQQERGGREALLYDLLNEDLTGFNPRILPKTKASFDMKMNSARSEEKYWAEALQQQSCDIGNTDPQTGWTEINKSTLFNDYCVYCNKNKLPQSDISSFMKRTKKIIPSITEAQPRKDGARQRLCCLPTIEVARAEFDKYFVVDGNHWNE
jgi:hypothetical protein